MGALCHVLLPLPSSRVRAGFWEALLESQHLLIAAGAPYLDDRVTRMLMPSQMVSIFRNIEGSGFVAPVGQKHGVLEIGHADMRIPAVVVTSTTPYTRSHFLCPRRKGTSSTGGPLRHFCIM
jgi:hypothetical protein